MKTENDDESKVNGEITAPNVRLLDEEGEAMGIVTISQAMNLARNAKLDLVEIVPHANPPVCKMMDFIKFKYEKKKAQREQSRKQRENRTVIKEIQFRPNTDTNDIAIKTKRACGFLEKGNHVRFVVKFRGRELSHVEQGKTLLDRVLVLLGDVTVEQESKMTGRNMVLTVSPHK